MAACRFRVAHVSVEPNVRGQEMRRVRLLAVPSDVFVAGDLPEGVTQPDPSAEISMLVNKDAAKRFSLGDEFDVIFREVES